VKRNDEISIAEIKTLNHDRICISPGPGRLDNPGINS
jgi:anthranilate synthase component 2